MAALQAVFGSPAAALRGGGAVAARAAAPAPGGLGLAAGRPCRRCGSGAKASGGRQQTLRPARAAAEKEIDFALVPWDASRETWDDESAQRMADLMRRFEAADTDGNGVIDRAELQSLLERVGGGSDEVPLHWLTDEDVDEVLSQYDANKDGVISFDEFARMSLDNVFLLGKLEEYREAFKAVDVGGNGSVSPTELYKLLERMEQPITYEKLVKIMEKYDVDQSGVIDFGEFLRLFRDELLDLKEVLDFVKQRSAPKAPPAAAAAAAPAAAPAAPAAKPGKLPKLVEGGVTLIFSEEEFDAVLAAHPDKLIVVMASVTWCRPCRSFQEIYEKAAKHYNDAIFLKFFGNSNESTKTLFKERLKCRTTPSFLFFKNGQIVERCTGAVASRMDDHLRRAYGPDGPTQPRLWV
jgi:Ca2+-binding EF-hand superfamily protein/thiol-disulfide isomerase/thioredoxin